MYTIGMLCVLTIAIVLLCVLLGMLLKARKWRYAAVLLLFTLALGVEAVNVDIGANVRIFNAALHHDGFANQIYRATPEAPFHWSAGVLAGLALLFTHPPRLQRAKRGGELPKS